MTRLGSALTCSFVCLSEGASSSFKMSAEMNFTGLGKTAFPRSGGLGKSRWCRLHAFVQNSSNLLLSASFSVRLHLFIRNHALLG